MKNAFLQKFITNLKRLEILNSAFLTFSFRGLPKGVMGEGRFPKLLQTRGMQRAVAISLCFRSEYFVFVLLSPKRWHSTP